MLECAGLKESRKRKSGNFEESEHDALSVTATQHSICIVCDEKTLAQLHEFTPFNTFPLVRFLVC